MRTCPNDGKRCSCPFDGYDCIKYHNQKPNGCRGIVNAFILIICIVLLLWLCTGCERKLDRVVNTPQYTVDKITIDSVQYIIANGTGTAIIKHEPGAIKE